MAIDKKLLEILVCPATKVPVKPLAKDRLAILNQCIDSGEVKHMDGAPVQGALSEALITTDDHTIYVVDNGIPIMLEEQGISANQVPGW
jgi:uncharacterized protein YbaR (Trm112 family)